MLSGPAVRGHACRFDRACGMLLLSYLSLSVGGFVNCMYVGLVSIFDRVF